MNDILALRNKPLIIGIDAGVDTGFAVYSRKLRRLIVVSTIDFWTAYDAVRSYPRKDVAVIIEAPQMNRPVFDRDSADSHKKHGRLAMNVGSVKRESQLLAEGLRRDGYLVIEEKPSTQKWTAEYFKRITGWDKRCSQHARDAAKLVFGL